MDTYPLVMQRAHLRIPGMATGTTLGVQTFPTASPYQGIGGSGDVQGRGQRWLFRRSRHDRVGVGHMRRRNRGDLLRKHALERFTEVLEELQAVSHVNGCGRATGRPVGIRRRPVAADDGHARMLLQPGGKAISGAVRQQINRLTAFQIDQDGTKHLALAQRKGIHAQHARRRRDGQGIAAGQAEQRGWADGHTLALGETRARCSTNLKPYAALCGTEARRPSRASGNKVG